MTTPPPVGVEATVAEVVALASELIAIDTTNTADPTRARRRTPANRSASTTGIGSDPTG